MILGSALRAVLIGVASLGLTPAMAQSKAPLLPPYTPAYEPRTVDERGMWMEPDEAERGLRDSPLVVHDEQLNAYVKRVLCNTVGQDRCRSVRIYVLEVPALNASMAPNGAMVVWTGLLLRVRSEAELGAVLGHEFAHFELRHSLQGFKRQRGATDAMAWLSVLGAISNSSTSLSQLLIAGSFYHFSREQEKQADLLALKYLAASSYPTIAASQIWQHMMEEQDATALGRKQKRHHRYSAGFFDSHPTELNRAVYLAEAASKLPGGTNPAIAGHQAGIAKVLPLMLADQIKLNNFGGSEYLLRQLASTNGWSGDLLFARAELYRLRANPRDLVTAAQFYSDAIRAGYSAPEAQRGLGLSLMRSGQVSVGKTALAEYLKLKPDASDAKAISALLAN